MLAVPVSHKPWQLRGCQFGTLCFTPGAHGDSRVQGSTWGQEDTMTPPPQGTLKHPGHLQSSLNAQNPSPASGV